MEKVTGLRAKETHSIIEAAGLKTTNMLIVFFAPPAIAVLLFGLYVVYSSVNNKLDSTLAFTTLSLFNTLRFPLVVLPRAIKNMAEAIAALRRIQTFLMSPEVQSVHKAGGSEEQIMLQFDNASIAYRKDVPLDDPVAQAKPVELVEVMKDITFSLQRGKKMALVGTVGSGKSTIMLAALSETRITKGKVVSSGSIAYVPQFPWVQVLDYIVFVPFS
jgi:ABC-type multidrug transport system fused ATPase/permease subunit